MSHADAKPPWRIAPGVIRLPDRRLAGGAPFRVVRLGERADAQLSCLLGTTSLPPDGSTLQALTATLIRYGLIVPPAPEPVEPRSGDVTVVIPALSTASAIAALLETIPPQVRVVVVDDGSQPALEPDLPPRANCEVLRHERPRGPAAARNAGARRGATPWIAFVDTDVVPPEGWLGMLLAHGAGPSTVAVAPRIVGAEVAGSAGFLERWSDALDLGAAPAEVAPGLPVPYVPSAVLLVRRAAFWHAGGFDESLTVGEDVDLVWRLVGAGRVRYEPGIVCRHRPRSSPGAVVRRRFQYGTSSAALSRRHPGALRHVDVSVWSWAAWLIAIGLHPVAGGAAAVVGVAMAPSGLRGLQPRDARRLAARGQLLAFAALGRWLVRPMFPIAIGLALVSPRLRRSLAWAAGFGVADLVRRRIGPLARPGAVSLAAVGKVIAAGVVDDAAYSTGVWVGCLRERTVAPLLPRVRRRERQGRRGGP